MDRLIALIPHHGRKWFIYTLILLMPGSFLVILAGGLYQLWTRGRDRSVGTSFSATQREPLCMQ
jgi:4-amino-4-deoxy-L-arabinose transferase-like glycosyltransferase